MRKFIYFITLGILFSYSLIFAQWIQQNSGTTNRFLTCFFLNENVGWAAGYDGTIMKTSNGGSNWISKNIGTLDDVHAIFFRDSLFGWAVLYEFSPFRHGSIIHSTDGGDSWNVQLSVWDYTIHSIHFTDENNGWVAGSSGIVFHTTNGGNSWIQQYPPTGGSWLWPIFFIDNNVGWTAGDPLFGLFKSTNGGNTWLTYSVPVVERIHSIKFLDYQTGWLCGTQGQIAKSLDGGITWADLQTGTSAALRDIFFVDNNTGWCVGYNGTILYTLDGGTNWNTQNSGTSYNLFGLYFVDALTGWAVGDNGIILKTINGGIPVELISFFGEVELEKVILNWSTATELNNSGFEIERKYENQDWLKIGFVAGNGTSTEKHIYQFEDKPEKRGDYRYRLKQIDHDGTTEYSNEITVQFTPKFTFGLEQNYPNPFNPSTTMVYSIQSDGLVSLKVYDILGNEVLTLVNENKVAGYYEVQVTAKNLPSGIYFYKLTSGDFQQTKKFILLK